MHAVAILFNGQISRTFYACPSVERGDPHPGPEPSQPQIPQGYAHLRNGDSRLLSLLFHRDQRQKNINHIK